MKLLIFVSLFFSIYGKCCAQNYIDDSKAIAMLKEFYTAHAHIEASIRTLPPKVYLLKSDSLKKKYCALKLRSIIKKYDENGMDFLTKDQGIDIKSLNTLKIAKEPNSDNIYLVSYDYLDKNFPKKPIEKHIGLNVKLVNEGGNYKINSIQ